MSGDEEFWEWVNDGPLEYDDDLKRIYDYAHGLGRGEGDLRTDVICIANAVCNLVTLLQERRDGHKPYSKGEN